MNPEAVRRQAVLQEMGVDIWVRRQPDGETVNADSVAPAARLPADIEAGDWASLNETIRSCTACGLHESRTQAVCGVGNEQAEWLVIGEAPGADEDRRGEPFVGRAGQLLNEMLRAAGRPREQVYIANILKCRPPNNRDPKPEEVECCMPFLQRQIAMLRPKLILVVGRIAAQNLLQTDTPIGRMRGQVYSYGDTDIPVVVTYHPAYLLRSPGQKSKAWEDLQLAMSVSGSQA